MMKKYLFPVVVLVLVLFLISSCALKNVPITQITVGQTTEETPDTEVDLSTKPIAILEHSELYIPNVSVEDVILYFNEVCLDAERTNSGDSTKLQRWENPIRYICNGTYTDADKKILDDFVTSLNTLDGFPGMQETQESALANLNIYFCEQSEYLAIMGEGFSETDGGVTFWYTEANEIYDAVIGIRTDIEQEVRDSVIIEEIYNGLGPINDTQLRQDSVIYAEFSTPQRLSCVDELIIKLLYHPQMQCGMDAADCAAVIRQLYY